VLIVDDEAPARLRLRQLLADLAEQVPNEVAGEAANGVEALEKLAESGADVALVDIRMPRMDGIELARHLAAQSRGPAVIFVTAYDQYAVTAFDLSAVDYLLKPVRIARLADALRKVARTPTTGEALRQAGERLAPGGRRQLRCSERGKVLLVPAAEVIYFRADLKYVVARTAEREYLLEESLAQLEQEFGDRLLRIHRNCLVARQAIRGFEREREAAAGEGEAHWVLLLHGVPEHLPVSRRQWPQVKAALGG
jgi:two-component system response regulator AlgR